MTAVETTQGEVAGFGPEVLLRSESTLSRMVRLFWRNPIVIGAVAVFLVITISAVLAPVLAPHDPLKISLANRLQPPFWNPEGDLEYILGTDALGRDILSRIMYGSRVSLLVGFVPVVLAGTLGVTLGLIAGYLGGGFDQLIMRIADVQLAFPVMLLAIAVMAVVGPGLVNILGVLAFTVWVSYARVVRGETLSLREREFILAAKAIGQREWVIMVRHILPNVTAAIIVVFSFAVPIMILTEAGLTFLGVGVETTTPTWGNMIADGRDYIDIAWWLTTFPGIALMLTVLSINLIGDWLRDVLDPRLRM
jgi:peptide/nickel transport system permease protein